MRKLKIYLAARYGRREELAGYADWLTTAGYTVTSRWLRGDHQATDADLEKDPDVGAEGTVPDRTRFATEDLTDLRAADVVAAFTEPPHAGPSRGGRHVELGVAIERGQVVFVIGHRENVFCCLPQIHFHPEWGSATSELASLLVRHNIGVGLPGRNRPVADVPQA